MLKAIFFDLDGTLLPLDEEKFTKLYFHLLSEKLANFGYDKEKLINTVLYGTKLMIKNDGKNTNEEVFWNYFCNIYGKEKLVDKKLFDDFYLNEFEKTKTVYLPNPKAKEIIDFCKKNNLKTILSTNPLFPIEAVDKRLQFLSLSKDDFDYISSYEFCKYSKINTNFYKEILSKLNLNAEETILFGNNALEDGENAEKVGIKTFMVGDYITNKDKVNSLISEVEFNDIINVIKKYMEN